LLIFNILYGLEIKAVLIRCAGRSMRKANLATTHELLHAQNDATNSNVEFFQLYSVVAADALL
jgi:hypothetical protein